MSSPLKQHYIRRSPDSRALIRDKKRAREKWKRKPEQDRSPQPKIKYKTTYRVKARTKDRGRLVFFKTRTKMPITTIRRLMARGNVTEDRITI